jgi:hypothetical protein
MNEAEKAVMKIRLEAQVVKFYGIIAKESYTIQQARECEVEALKRLARIEESEQIVRGGLEISHLQAMIADMKEVSIQCHMAITKSEDHIRILQEALRVL